MLNEKIQVIFKKYEEFLNTHSEDVIKNTINGAGPAGRGQWVRDTLFYKYCVRILFVTALALIFILIF